MAMFFVLFALLLFVWALKENKSRFFAFSGVLLGLAILTKVYTLLFIPVLLVYALYFNKKEKKKLIDKKLAGKLFYFLIVAFLFAIPSLTHNYLLYKDKGFVDLIYTNALGIGKNVSAQYYSWDSGWGMGADWHGFFLGNSIHMGGDPLPSSLYPFEFILYNDPIALIFGILGLAFLLFRKRWEYPLLFLFVLVFVFSYLAARILLAKHYAFLLLFLIMPASFLISGIDDSIKRKFPKFRIRYVLVALLFLSLVLLGLKTPFAPSSFYSPSEVSQMMSYKNSGIPQDALIVGDSRIYRGEIHWMFQGREYIESSYLAQLLSASQQTGKATPVDVYYVECAVDDCGWGTIKNQPDFNASMEQITSFFAANGNLVKEINSPGSYPLSSDSGTSYFRVYKTTLSIDTSLYSQLESQKVWFLYPIGYNESIAPIFDKYNIHSEADELIDYFAHWIVYLSIVLAFLAILASIYLFLELR